MEQSGIRGRETETIVIIWVKDGRSQIKAMAVGTKKVIQYEDIERTGFDHLGSVQGEDKG